MDERSIAILVRSVRTGRLDAAGTVATLNSYLDVLERDAAQRRDAARRIAEAIALIEADDPAATQRAERMLARLSA